jgi:hypothetical protein
MFKRASKYVCTPKVVASPNSLPSPSTISDRKIPENTENFLMSRISR